MISEEGIFLMAEEVRAFVLKKESWAHHRAHYIDLVVMSRGQGGLIQPLSGIIRD